MSMLEASSLTSRKEPLVALLRRIWCIEAFALSCYFGRDAFAGAGRYYLNVVRLDALWFFPDIVAFACIAIFIRRYVMEARNLVATLLVFYTVFALVLGYVFLDSFAGMVSSFKMFAPIFVGFCFSERQMKEYPWTLRFITFLFYASIVGVLISARVQLPWVGYAYESFGATRQAGRLWWTGSELRLAGFAADNTMAGFFILITFVFTSIRKNLWWALLWSPIAIYTVKITTSKTSLGVLIVYVIALIIVRSFRDNQRFAVTRLIALSSFLAIFIPIILIVVFSGDELTDTSKTLFSMQDRINNSWQRPFLYMYDLMPIGYFTGCGLGCFNYPQQVFSPYQIRKYYVAVDNFYLGTYLMFGPIFIAFMICVIRAVARTPDVHKLTIVFIMNVFTITVLSYGPASGLLLIGFAFSDVFARSENRAMAGGASRRLDWRQRASRALSPPGGPLPRPSA